MQSSGRGVSHAGEGPRAAPVVIEVLLSADAPRMKKRRDRDELAQRTEVGCDDVPQVRVSRCSTCSLDIPTASFSTSQLRHGKCRRCPRCVTIAHGGGPLVKAAMFDHAESRGRIDGAAHRLPGRRLSDRSRRAITADREGAASAVLTFNTNWPVATWEPEGAVLQDLGQLAGALCWLQPQLQWAMQGNSLCDFITTIRGGITRTPVLAQPTKHRDELWPVGTLTDAPHASACYEMRYTCKDGAQFYVSSMRSESIVRHWGG